MTQRIAGRQHHDTLPCRLRRANPLAGGGLELLDDYAGFETDFLAFFPDAQAFTASLRADRDRTGA